MMQPFEEQQRIKNAVISEVVEDIRIGKYNELFASPDDDGPLAAVARERMKGTVLTFLDAYLGVNFIKPEGPVCRKCGEPLKVEGDLCGDCSGEEKLPVASQ